MKTTVIKANVTSKKIVTIGRAKLIEVPMYRCGIEVLFKKETEKIEHVWNNTVDYGGKTRDYLESDQRVMITFPTDKPPLSTVVHELCHATQFILKNRGHNYYTQDGDEPFAYLLAHLVEEYLEIKKKKK